jgi:hypothetical protein
MKSYDRRMNRGTALFVVSAAALGLAACSSAPSATATGQGQGQTSTTSAHESAVNAPMKVKFGTGSIGQADPTTTLPNERGNAIPSILAPGQNIIIASSGCKPQTLEASVTAPVVWTNLSGKPQRVIFTNFPIDSGTIPVGGTFTWSTHDAVAMAYRVEPSGKICKLLMNAAQP